MTSLSPIALGRAFLARPNNDPVKTVGVAFMVALVCSILVSVTAVTLKPLQDANRLKASSASLFGLVQTLGWPSPTMHFVDRTSGAYLQRERDGKTELPPDKDVAGLGTVEDTLTVYEARENGKLVGVLLPVRGSGYASTMHGILALQGDLNTVAALVFHQQNETPGLGARVAEDAWQSLWPGKKIASADGTIRIRVVKGDSSGPYEVDGISGATRTSSGVSNLVRFWMGDDGYGPYLNKLEQGGGE